MRHMRSVIGALEILTMKNSLLDKISCLFGLIYTIIVSTDSSFAETVGVTKDCTGSTCTVSGTSAGPGFFRLNPGMNFNWEAAYTGTTQNFWIGQGGPSTATVKLSQTTGQIGGTSSQPLGIWYISIQTALMGSGSYSVFGPNVWGDPHITTMNGVHFDFQGAGEFSLLKYGKQFEVQSRMHPIATASPLPPNPYTGLSSCVSVNTAAALRVGEQRLTYQPRLDGQPDPTGMEIRVDGKLVNVGSDGLELSDGSKVSKNEDTGEVRVTYADESSVRIIPNWWAAKQIWYLDYDFTPPEGAVGIAGPVPEGSWLPLLADGSSAGAKPPSVEDRYQLLYVKFAESWRVNGGNTLFDYAPGTSSKTYTIKEWPGLEGKCELPFQVPLVGTSLEKAKEACADVIVPHMKEGCVQDVLVTGDPVFGRSYLKGQGTVKVIAKIPMEEAK